MATSGNFNSGNNFTYTYGGYSITCNASWASSITRAGTASKASVKLTVTVRHVSGDESGYAMYYHTAVPTTSNASQWTLLASNNQTHYAGGSTTLSGTYTQAVGNAAGTLTGYVIIAVGQSATSYVYYYGQYSLSYPAKTSYTISYNANGGSGTVSAQTKYYGESLKLRSNSYTRANYSFAKWNTAANGSGTDYAAGGTYTANKAATLYAQWNALGSTVSVSFNNSSGVATITVAKANSAYTHSLAWQFGALSGYIDSSGSLVEEETIFSAASVTATYTLNDLYRQIPTSETGTLTITCKTYNGDTYVGATTGTATVTVPATVKPAISGTFVTDSTTQSLTGSTTKVILNATWITIDNILTIGYGGASVTDIQVNGVSYGAPRALILLTATTGSFSVVAIDSRGRSSDPITASYSVINYTIPIIAECTASRTTAASTNLAFRIAGTAWYGSFQSGATNAIKATFSATSSSGNTKSGTIGTATIASNGTFTISSTISGFTYAETWTIDVTINDGTSSYPLKYIRMQIEGPPGIPVFDWGESDFNFNVPVTYTENGTAYSFLTGAKLSFNSGNFSQVSTTSSTAANVGSISLSPGFWLIVVTATFASNSSGNRNIRIANSSGGSAIDNGASVMIRASTSASTVIQLVYPVKVTATKSYYVVALQNSGSSLNVNANWKYIGILT